MSILKCGETGNIGFEQGSVGDGNPRDSSYFFSSCFYLYFWRCEWVADGEREQRFLIGRAKGWMEKERENE